MEEIICQVKKNFEFIQIFFFFFVFKRSKMKGEQHEYYGDNLSQFVDNGGKVMMLGWAPYKDGLF